MSVVDRVCDLTAAVMAAMTTIAATMNDAHILRILMIFTFRYDQCVIALKILQLNVSHSKEQIEYKVNSEEILGKNCAVVECREHRLLK